MTMAEGPNFVKVYFSYDGEGRLGSTYKDNSVEVTNFTYDSAGTVFLTTPPSDTSPGGTSRYYFDELGQAARSDDALGNPTYRTYDDIGNLTRVTDPDGRSTLYAYDKKGNEISNHGCVRRNDAIHVRRPV